MWQILLIKKLSLGSHSPNLTWFPFKKIGKLAKGLECHNRRSSRKRKHLWHLVGGSISASLALSRSSHRTRSLQHSLASSARPLVGRELRSKYLYFFVELLTFKFFSRKWFSDLESLCFNLLSRDILRPFQEVRNLIVLLEELDAKVFFFISISSSSSKSRWVM